MGVDDRDFPLRPFYPYVQTISTDSLLEKYFDAILIDVRNRFEFDVIHISKARHILLSDENFIDSVSRYRAKVSDTALVFYCNDPACTSAFRAALLVQNAGFTNVYVYDTGVFPLLEIAPEKITLMATTPAQPDLVIPADYAEKVLVDFEQFNKRAGRLNSLIIDIRDIYTRMYTPRLENIHNISMEAFLAAVTNRIWFGKNLLIFDQDGTKVKWLQYFLQANGYSNYAFLRGGIDGLDQKTQAKKIAVFNSWITFNQVKFAELTKDNRLTALDLRIMNLLAASIRYEHYALVRQGHISAALRCSAVEFKEAINRLKSSGYLLFRDSGETMMFHINPRLAWKGVMSGTVWAKRVREFDLAACPPGGQQ